MCDCARINARSVFFDLNFGAEFIFQGGCRVTVVCGRGFPRLDHFRRKVSAAHSYRFSEGTALFRFA